jgi:hypothetical protein
MRRKILLLTGSLNQTSQMHEISKHLNAHDCWFSQVFSDSPLLNTVLKYTPILDGTVLSEKFRIKCENYLNQHGLQIDQQGLKNQYDLVVCCTDMVFPEKFRNIKTVWVQEGMIDERTVLTALVQALGLPNYFSADTSLNGSSNDCDVYCTASEGYKNHLTKYGTDRHKLIVTGIPNFDNDRQFLNNDFPHHNYVMVATSDVREIHHYENRPRFIKHATKIANGRQMLFKLHPNEKFDRAEAEIRKYAPAGTLIYNSGNTNHMIANCCELVTQYSTVVFAGISMGKKVHSYFNVDRLRKLVPVQNGGVSARNIAQVCNAYLEFEGKKEDFLSQFTFQPEVVEYPEVQYA